MREKENDFGERREWQYHIIGWTLKKPWEVSFNAQPKDKLSKSLRNMTIFEAQKSKAKIK